MILESEDGLSFIVPKDLWTDLWNGHHHVKDLELAGLLAHRYFNDESILDEEQKADIKHEFNHCMQPFIDVLLKLQYRTDL